MEKEYIIPADEPFPSYHRQQNNRPQAKKQFPHLAKVHSQVLQTTIRRLHDTWETFRKRGHGFPRFKKLGQFKSFVFPQFKDTPINDLTINLPKIGAVTINLHRPIPDGFKVKQVQVLSRVRGTQWYVVVTIESRVSGTDTLVHGRAIGVDLGLERFLTTSDGSFQERPKFFKHRDHAAAEMVLHRGLDNVVAQGLWGMETACQVGLSGVYDLDKWRGAGIPNQS